MSDVTRVLRAIADGDPRAAAELLPLVYHELRTLAAQKLSQEKPGQTLQATALVHEAYLRLVDVDQAQQWNGRGHFFAAAAEAMRRILVESARRKLQLGRGGDRQRIPFDAEQVAADAPSEDLLALDESLHRLEDHDALAAKLVKLRYFAGLSHQDAAKYLGLSRATADRYWAYAKAFLFAALQDHRDF